MGIVAVGLLGVIAILPVAGTRVTQGMVADMADRVGRNGFRQFEIMHMGRSSMWVEAQGNGAPSPNFDKYVAYVPGAKDAFCIDPLFITQVLADNSPAWKSEWGQFPCVTGTPVWMKRISLRKYPGAADAMGYDSSATPPHNKRCAAQIFMAEDDLTVDFPSDRTLPPIQNFGMASSAAQKRQSEGNFSWLAMVTPTENGSDQGVVWIVVFHRRIVDATEERVLAVTQFGDAGLHGGEVTLQSTSADNLKMKQGEWIMLAGTYSADSTRKLFRWYRVQSAGSEVRSVSGNYERDVTLQGQDWPTTLIASPANPPWPPAGTLALATWIPGTVAVYEKTARCETTSLWTEF
jgi:hypothetical protein